MPVHARILAGLAALFCVLAPPAAAQQIGIAIDVDPGAAVEAVGRQRPLSRRDPIRNGDVILTNATGTVQIAFQDRTRVVVGPNSRFEVGNIELRTRERASRFTVNAISGTFRFLSGESDKDAYAIRTPTATMGIRGTEFDFAVRGGITTTLITFRGQVRICGNTGRCARVSGGCATAGIDQVGQVFQPEDRAARDALIVDEFPFIVNQAALRPNFRTSTSSCGAVARRVRVERERDFEPARGGRTAPERQPDPAPEPEPERPRPQG